MKCLLKSLGQIQCAELPRAVFVLKLGLY